MNTKITLNLKTLLIIGIIVIAIIGGGSTIIGSKITGLNSKIEQQQNIANVLQDSLHFMKNKYGEVTAQKLSLQTSIQGLNSYNNKLNKNQKELLNRIKSLNKKNKIISAALIETKTKMDSLLYSNAHVVVDKKDTSVTLSKATDSLSFNITIGKVVPINSSNPTIRFNSLIIPNKQFVEFHWDAKNKNRKYPVSFTISNSSPFVITTNADSYIIPQVNYNKLHPNFWQKVKFFMNKPGVKITGDALIFIGGVYVGSRVL